LRLNTTRNRAVWRWRTPAAAFIGAIAGVLLALLYNRAAIFGTKSAKTFAPQPFKVLRQTANIQLGSNSFRLTTNEEGNARWQLAPDLPLEFVVENWVLYPNVTVWSGDSVVTLRKGNPIALPKGWDMNQDSSAMEIVNGMGAAVFRVQRTGDMDISVIGYFHSNASSRAVTVTQGGMLISPADGGPQWFPAIFKYPSKEHMGERISTASTRPRIGIAAEPLWYQFVKTWLAIWLVFNMFVRLLTRPNREGRRCRHVGESVRYE